MKAVIGFLFVLLMYCPVSSQDLPPEILADMYLLDATKALEDGDAQEAIRAFGKIEALDIEPPHEFPYWYGKLLVEKGSTFNDLLKGQRLLKSYVIRIERGSEHYNSSLELLSDVSRKLRRLEEEAAEARQAKVKELEVSYEAAVRNLQALLNFEKEDKYDVATLAPERNGCLWHHYDKMTFTYLSKCMYYFEMIRRGGCVPGTSYGTERSPVNHHYGDEAALLGKRLFYRRVAAIHGGYVLKFFLDESDARAPWDQVAQSSAHAAVSVITSDRQTQVLDDSFEDILHYCAIQ